MFGETYEGICILCDGHFLPHRLRCPSASRSTQQICSEARQYLTETRIPAPEETLYVKKSSHLRCPLSSWDQHPCHSRRQYCCGLFFQSPIFGARRGDVRQDLIFSRAQVTTKAETIELTGRNRARGERCEPRGKRAIKTRVEINEYIDFHARQEAIPILKIISATRTARSCARTERAGEVAGTFQFRDVKPTTGG